ncbi:MAG: hypothetical protein R3C59_04795 [Planctomycetaceae bacterium]
MTQASDIFDTGNNRRSQMTRQQIGRLVDELDTLSRTECDPVRFRHELLSRAVHGTAAVAGLVWVLPGSQEFVESQPSPFECQIGLENITGSAGNVPPPAAWSPLFEESTSAAEPLTVAANGQTGNGSFRNPSSNILTVAAFPANGDLRGGLMLFHEPDVSPEFQRGTQQLLAVLCELAGDFQRNHQLRELTILQSEQRAFEQFRQAALNGSDLQTLAHAIANEGQRFLKCDRVSVVVRCNRRFIVRSVSGVDSIDRRSTTVRRLQDLANVAAAEGSSRWFEPGQNMAAEFLTETARPLSESTRWRPAAICQLQPKLFTACWSSNC